METFRILDSTVGGEGMVGLTGLLWGESRVWGIIHDGLPGGITKGATICWLPGLVLPFPDLRLFSI